MITTGSASHDPDFLIEGDIDGDGVLDEFDNCVNVPNEGQVDTDSNSQGDICQDFYLDRDGDGIADFEIPVGANPPIAGPIIRWKFVGLSSNATEMAMAWSMRMITARSFATRPTPR